MELLLRLIKDGKIVGYEKHESGEILHCPENEFLWNDGNGCWHDILELIDMGPSWESDMKHLNYIPHDRADLYTGITLSDGTKVFENDELEDEKGNKYPVKRVPGGFAVPTWPNCTDRKWDFYTPLSEMQNYAWAKHTKITGIKGVSND